MKTKAMKALLLQHPIDKAASPSDREINTTPESFMSEKDKSLFIEKHPDGYAILRGGVKKPLAVEATQEAAIEKAIPRIVSPLKENLDRAVRHKSKFE